MAPVLSPTSDCDAEGLALGRGVFMYVGLELRDSVGSVVGVEVGLTVGPSVGL